MRRAFESSKENLFEYFANMFFFLHVLVAWYKENYDKWWGDISGALVPHPPPLKLLPNHF